MEKKVEKKKLSLASQKPPKYWLSLDQRVSDSSKSGEFLSPPMGEEKMSTVDRRSFLKIMGASSLMASLAGCTRRPVQKIVPYVSKPEEITPGVPNHYTSADPVSGYGLLLTTREGRPVKVDGNPDHPLNGKGLDAIGQASIFSLYDPDRLRKPMIGGKEVSWEEFYHKLAPELGSKKRTYFLTTTVTSPSLQGLINVFSKNHYQFDPMSFHDIRQGQKESFGTPVLPRYRIHRARVIVSIDGDFLDSGPSSVEYMGQFHRFRSLIKNVYGKFIAYESSMRLTGQNADIRVPIHPAHQLKIALGLAHEVSRSLGKKMPELSPFSLSKVAAATGVDRKILEETVQALVKNKGRGLVIAGGICGKSFHAVALQNVVNFINSLLGNDGRTVDASISPYRTFQGSIAQVEKLIQAMNRGVVDTLVIQGFSPSYHLSKYLGFEKALQKVGNVVYVGSYNDETARRAKFVAAESHPFESWGDTHPVPGLYSIVQPTIRPLFSTQSFSECLLAVGSRAGLPIRSKNAYELVRGEWKRIYKKHRVRKSFESFWEDSLEKGFYDTMRRRRDYGNHRGRKFRKGALSSAVAVANNSPAVGNITLVLQPSIPMGMGMEANNAHLQELPDPVTKITWGNCISLSPIFADKLGVKDGDVLSIGNAHHRVELPAHRQPGLVQGVLVANLGYGRTMGGRVSDTTGVALTEFMESRLGTLSYVANEISIRKTGAHDPLAITQEHHSLENRPVTFESTYEEYRTNPSAGIVSHGETISQWKPHAYTGYRWGMVIDLNACTGCSACVMACTVENNVPVVGKKEVLRGREMHWIRIDRYYKGSVENPETVMQPMLCQHCENAPCETVCPVIATVHSSEGLNQMIYNRCVGTRYCSNNCPYKVRRFNFFEYNAKMNEGMEYPLPFSKNPEVTIRSRGVMEKCTFCVQRIEYGKNTAKRAGRKVVDGDIQTACQAACPANAITFGDINNNSSDVSHQRNNPRGFTVLEELNVKPSITYLTKIWNRPAGSKHKIDKEGRHD